MPEIRVDIYCYAQDGNQTDIPFLNIASPAIDITLNTNTTLAIMERPGVQVFEHTSGRLITESNFREFFPNLPESKKLYGNGTVSQMLPGNNGCPIYLDKIDTMAYCIEYDVIDYDYAYKFFKDRFADVADAFSGACTAVYSDGFLGRNYDWYYDNAAVMLCKTHPSQGRNRVIGTSVTVSGAGSSFTYQDVESRKYMDKYKIIPFMLLDGMNVDTGLVCEINILQAGETINGHIAKTTKTIPTVEERDSVCTLMLVRYILDHFSTVQDVIENLPKYTSVYSTYTDTLKGEYHYMLADEDDVYILEFIPDATTGEMKMEFIDVSDRARMTNFHVYGSTLDEDNHVEYTSLTTYAMGIERYDLIADYLSSHVISSVSDMYTLMNQELKYTNGYTINDYDKAWLSEFTGKYTIEDVEYDITAADCVINREKVRPVYEYCQNLYAHRDRNIPNTWQTVHTSVYDITNRTVSLGVQEQTTYHTYKYKNPFEV